MNKNILVFAAIVIVAAFFALARSASASNSYAFPSESLSKACGSASPGLIQIGILFNGVADDSFKQIKNQGDCISLVREYQQKGGTTLGLIVVVINCVVNANALGSVNDFQNLGGKFLDQNENPCS